VPLKMDKKKEKQIEKNCGNEEEEDGKSSIC
jgi:hypothetical protein